MSQAVPAQRDGATARAADVRLAARTALIGLAGLGLVVLAVAVGSGPVDFVSEPHRSLSWSVDEGTPAPISGTRGPGLDGAAAPDLTWLWILVNLLTLALVGALIVWVLRLGTRRRWLLSRLSPAPVPTPVSVPALPEVPQELLGQAATDRRTALAEGEPRNAIVACWVQLQESLERAGILAQPWQSPTEYVTAVLSRWSVQPSALAQLAAGYREARFSDHPIDEAARARAIDALDQVHADLQSAAEARRPPAESA